jgi:hypothetical protein
MLFSKIALRFFSISSISASNASDVFVAGLELLSNEDGFSVVGEADVSSATY